MIADVTELLERMDKIHFDSSTDVTTFISMYFPSLTNKTHKVEQHLKELTFAVLEQTINALSQDSQKHTLLESYEYIENGKEEERRKETILSIIRTTYLR